MSRAATVLLEGSVLRGVLPVRRVVAAVAVLVIVLVVGGFLGPCSSAINWTGDVAPGTRFKRLSEARMTVDESLSVEALREATEWISTAVSATLPAGVSGANCASWVPLCVRREAFTVSTFASLGVSGASDSCMLVFDASANGTWCRLSPAEASQPQPDLLATFPVANAAAGGGEATVAVTRTLRAAALWRALVIAPGSVCGDLAGGAICEKVLRNDDSTGIVPTPEFPPVSHPWHSFMSHARGHVATGLVVSGPRATVAAVRTLSPIESFQTAAREVTVCGDFLGADRILLYSLAMFVLTVVALALWLWATAQLVRQGPRPIEGAVGAAKNQRSTAALASANNGDDDFNREPDWLEGTNSGDGLSTSFDASARVEGAAGMDGSVLAAVNENDESRKPLLTMKGAAVHVHSIGFAESVETDDDADQRAGAFLSDVASAAIVNDGHVSFAAPGEVVVTFNSVTPSIEPEVKAIAFVDALRPKETIRTTVFAIASGPLIVNPNSKNFTVFGPAVDTVRMLHRLQNSLAIPVVASEAVVFAAERGLKNRALPVDVIELPQRPAETLYELLVAPYGGDVDALKHIIALMTRCHFDQALRLMAPMAGDHAVRRLRRRCEELAPTSLHATRYSLKYLGWDAPTGRDQADALDSNPLGEQPDVAKDPAAASSISITGIIPEVVSEYDGVPVELHAGSDNFFMRSDKVVGNVLGATQYGGMSESGTPVAILVLDQTNRKEHGKIIRDAVSHVRSAGLLDHPGVVTVHAAAIVNKRWFMLVEEYLPGGDLAWLLREFHPLPPTAARRLSRELLNVLRHLTQRNVVHGNVNWSSLRVTLDGALKLVWFARAQRMAGSSISRTQTVRSVGSNSSTTTTLNTSASERHKSARVAEPDPCLAPEMAHEPCAPQSTTDMFSFGAVVLSLFCGKEAVKMDMSESDVLRAVNASAGVSRDMARDLVDLAVRCFSKDPAQRLSASEAAFHRFFTAST